MTHGSQTPDEEIPPEWRERNAKVREMMAAEDAEKERQRAGELQKLKATLGIPAKFLRLVDGVGLRDTDALAEVRKGGFDLLVLGGALGRGKTTAACWWLLQTVKDRPKPLFVTAALLSRWERYDRAEMDRLLLASRLVIDDLGNEFGDTKGNFLAVLDEIIADRVANERPTVMTTNLPPAKFVERYGERVRDRIRESGRYQEFAGTSFRGSQQLGLLPPTEKIHE